MALQTVNFSPEILVGFLFLVNIGLIASILSMPTNNPDKLEMHDLDFNPFFWTPSTWERFLSSVGPVGRAQYTWGMLTLDVILPLFETLWIFFTFRYFVFKRSTVLAYFPFITLLIDVFGENLIGVYLTTQFPFLPASLPLITQLVSIRNYIKLVKYSIFLPAALTSLIVGVYLLGKSALGGVSSPKTTNTKKKA